MIFSVPFATGKMKFPLLSGVNTSLCVEPSGVEFRCVHLLHFFNVCDHKCLLSRFSSHIIHSREIYLVRLLLQSDAVATGLSKKQDDVRPLLQTVLLVRSKAFRTALLKVFSHQKVYPEYFAESNNILWNPPTTGYPDRTAIAPQMCPLLLCELLLQQSHLFLICVVLKYNDSRDNSSQDLLNSKELSV